MLSSVLARLSLLGAWARSQLNKMWQETANQGGEGIKEVGLTSASKSLSHSFQACSGLSLPGRVQTLPPALPFELHRELVIAVRMQSWLGMHRERQNLGPTLIAAGAGALSITVLLWKGMFSLQEVYL